VNKRCYNSLYSNKFKEITMKKALLLSVVASTMIMAGGDIAPVEPVVEAPAPAVAAAEGAKISGTVKLWYGTQSRSANYDLFNAGNLGTPSQGNSWGDAYVDLKYSRKIMDNVTVNAGVAGLSTLGLENDLVSGTWADHGGLSLLKNNPAVAAAVVAAITAGNSPLTVPQFKSAVLGDAFWINEANVVVGLPSVDSFVKLGRQELDTPFFFSENWNIATNTFDAAVVGNTSLPDTTLVAAWVGRGNGAAGPVVALENTAINGGHVAFIGNNPAYAFAAINKSIENTTLQGWYYKIPSIANAYWLQADTNIAGFDLGAQYAGTSLNAVSPNVETNAWAVKLGYGMDNWSAYAAYSARNNKAGIDISNIATGVASGVTPGLQGGQSKLYTEAYWNYGFVGAQNAKTVAVGGSYDLGMAKVGAQYTQVNNGTLPNTATTGDLKEFAVTASTKVGPVNADLAYVYDKKSFTMKGASTALIMLSLPYSL
jgi:hypothetical protein